MKKSDVVHMVLGDKQAKLPRRETAKTWASGNVALCKYWGKRDQEINLPVTSSLSVSLGVEKGATTTLTVSHRSQDSVILNGQKIEWTSAFGKRLLQFINLFREDTQICFDIDIQSTIPIAAGLASSACGFASLVMAFNQIYDWKLNESALSILARLGSGSASRSVSQGFVEWRAGIRRDGMDSYGELVPATWPDFCVGLLIIDGGEKHISSREAMQRTVTTSSLYSAWPMKVSRDLSALRKAIEEKDFLLLGETAESNALTMHATMLSAWPPVSYILSKTIEAMQKIWRLRDEGLSLFFTQDAGPNLKLLFLEKDAKTVQTHFPEIDILRPFARI